LQQFAPTPKALKGLKASLSLVARGRSNWGNSPGVDERPPSV